MDLLSSYDVDDDTSNNNNDQNPSSRPVSNSGSLQSEWESFEKSIEQSNPIHSSTGPVTNSSHSEMRKSSSSDDSQIDEEVKGEQSQMMKMDSLEEKKDEIDDEDESHLPPGVRKKNRCHHSSSSSSEDEAEKKEGKGQSDSDMSDSDESDRSPNHSKAHATKIEKKEEEKQKPKGDKEEGASSKKARGSRSSSGSRSRSRSRSPRRKKRKSSERSRHSRSRSRGRHHRKDRKHGSRHSRSKDMRRSRDRDHRHRHRESRHSRSRSRERRNSQRDRRRSRDRGHRSNRDKRSRSRSQSPRGARVIKYGDKVIKAGASFGRPPPTKPMTFKEKMRQQLIKAMEEGGDVSQALTSQDGKVICTQTAGTQQMPAPKKPPVPLMSNLVTSTAGLTAATITASEAAMQSMLALQKETTEKTGVEIPKYYNPAAINPVKYAEQVQKRKLLWSKTKDKEVNSQWHATTLSSEHDDKSKEKFRKLMGIKQETAGSGAGDTEEKGHEEQEIKQRELFDKLDKEYQFARMATHTHRGIGLGFGSSGSYQPPST